MSPARAQKTKARVRLRTSRGPRRGLRQSSSPPPPPPPVGRRSTGGLPPMPGDLRSTSDGMGVKMGGIEDPCEVEVTSPFSWTHRKSDSVPEAGERKIGLFQLRKRASRVNSEVCGFVCRPRLFARAGTARQNLERVELG